MLSFRGILLKYIQKLGFPLFQCYGRLASDSPRDQNRMKASAIKGFTTKPICRRLCLTSALRRGLSRCGKIFEGMARVEPGGCIRALLYMCALQARKCNPACKVENTDKLTQGLRWIQTHDIRGKLTHL